MLTPDTRTFEERYNSCFVDLGVKTIAGLIIGGMLGSFFLRSARKWPLFIGGGTGVGMAYANCEKSLNEYLLSLEPEACLIKKQA
ncbi:MICOS complex subunit Mic10-like [Cydia pomonella]|uniref:MICOS complex subunit Mic10-like n=1 Tax=Cydia pomonella TaxID=82600 RepID=UPI002ADD51CD|nr:MICOS complex subunit Mic10-like [Cydia pomonella]